MKLSKTPLVLHPDLTLLPFQTESVKRSLYCLEERDEHGVYNACEQGLGKTIQSITYLNTLNALGKGKCLIIAPSSLLYTWRSELSKFFIGYDSTKVLIVEASKELSTVAGQAALRNAEFVILSYGLVIKEPVYKLLCRTGYKYLILDECHALKNPKTQRTKTILTRIFPICYYRVALSGTPFRSSIVDGFTLFNKFAPKLFPEYYSFAEQYTNATETPWGIKYAGVKNAEKLGSLIKDTFFIRYKKKDVLKDLPDIQYQEIIIPEKYSVKVNEKEKLSKLKEEAEYLINCIDNKIAIPTAMHMATHIHEQGLAKLPFVIEYMEEFLEQDIPLIVFGHHKDFIAALCDHFFKYKPSVITGATPPKRRFSEVKRFQEGETELIILNSQAGGEGVTLTRSSNIILGEAEWSVATIQQDVARSHRIGQKYKVTVHYFTVENSVEGKIQKHVIKNAQAFAAVTEFKN